MDDTYFIQVDRTLGTSTVLYSNLYFNAFHYPNHVHTYNIIFFFQINYVKYCPNLQLGLINIGFW